MGTERHAFIYHRSNALSLVCHLHAHLAKALFGATYMQVSVRHKKRPEPYK